ncbi:MAG: PIG-L family deacetylase [Anaerolineaceae bacterium]|nr:PIG-L family deacetylase [Anaerolineaceae bacterium]
MASNPQQIEAIAPEEWTESKRILVVLAHPDDPEFFCGATLARWASQAHEIHYLLLTRGDKGAKDRTISPEMLMMIREREECAAAAILGVRSVQFLDYPDGYLFPSLEARKAVVRVIRQIRPDVLVTSDPTNYYPRETYLNHPDHRVAGEITLAAIFPAAGNPLFFPELVDEEKLEPSPVKEVWITLTHQPNVVLDITQYWEQKMCALNEHKSQIGDPMKLRERQLSRRTVDSTSEQPRFEEAFRRLIFQ